MSKIDNIKKAVQRNELVLTKQLLQLNTFERLLSFLKTDAIRIEDVEIADIENGISIVGKTIFNGNQFEEAEICIYQNEATENGYDLLWYGKMSAIQLNTLNLPGIVSLTPIIPVSLLDMNFQESILSYEVQTETLQIKSLSTDHQIAFPLIHLRFKDLGILLEWYIPSGGLSRFNLEANIELGSTTIGVELDVATAKDRRNSLWTMILSHEFSLENGINDIANFLSKQELLAPLFGDGKLESALPDAVQLFKGLHISAFDLVFDPTKPAIYSTSLTLNYYANWTIFEGLTLNDIGLSIFITFHGASAAVTLKLFGSFSFIENWYVDFSIELSFNKESDWVIQLEGYADIEKLEQLEGMNLFKLENLNLPPEWLLVRDIRLNKLEIVFNPLKGKVKSVDFAVELTAESTIIPGITLRNPKLELKINFDE